MDERTDGRTDERTEGHTAHFHPVVSPQTRLRAKLAGSASLRQLHFTHFASNELERQCLAENPPVKFEGAGKASFA